MPRPLAGSPDLTISAADAILQSQQPEVEAEAESAELVEVQRAVPADEGLWLDDRDGLQDRWEPTIQLD